MNCSVDVQLVIVSLFALSLYVKMWQHSISTMISVTIGAVACFIFPFYPFAAKWVIIIGAIVVVMRGARKPKSERIWG